MLGQTTLVELTPDPEVQYQDSILRGTLDVVMAELMADPTESTFSDAELVLIGIMMYIEQMGNVSQSAYDALFTLRNLVTAGVHSPTVRQQLRERHD